MKVTVRWETAAGARLACFRLQVGPRVSWCTSAAGVARVLSKDGFRLSDGAVGWLDRHGKTGVTHVLRRFGPRTPR